MHPETAALPLVDQVAHWGRDLPGDERNLLDILLTHARSAGATPQMSDAVTIETLILASTAPLAATGEMNAAGTGWLKKDGTGPLKPGNPSPPTGWLKREGTGPLEPKKDK